MFYKVKKKRFFFIKSTPWRIWVRESISTGTCLYQTENYLHQTFTSPPSPSHHQVWSVVGVRPRPQPFLILLCKIKTSKHRFTLHYVNFHYSILFVFTFVDVSSVLACLRFNRALDVNTRMVCVQRCVLSSRAPPLRKIYCFHFYNLSISRTSDEIPIDKASDKHVFTRRPCPI